MKLTADRNEAPPKKKKKLKRKSKEKIQKNVQSPQRKHLLVDKVLSHITLKHLEVLFSRIVTHLHVLKILNSLQIHSRHTKLKNQNLIHLSQMPLINRKLANFICLGRNNIFQDWIQWFRNGWTSYWSWNWCTVIIFWPECIFFNKWQFQPIRTKDNCQWNTSRR